MTTRSDDAPGPIEARWLHEHAEISLDDLAELSGLAPALLRELVEMGALNPTDLRAQQWHFASECVVSVRRAGRLREDFDLDANALSVALNLVERIQELERELHHLRSQFPRVRVR